MKIFVKATPNAKEQRIQKIDETHWLVSVKESPKQGKANRAIAKALARHFKTALSNIKLVSGFSAKQKVFEILRNEE